MKGAVASRMPDSPVETQWQWLNWPGRARWTVTLLFLALVTWLMLAPGGTFKDVGVFFAHQDKMVHGAIFLTLALLVRWSLPGASGRGALGAAVLALLVVYAGSIEALQPLLAGAERKFEWLDMASNYTGLCAGWLLLGRLAVE